MRIKCFMLACLLVFSIFSLGGSDKSSNTEASDTEVTSAETTTAEKTVHNIETLSPYYDSIDEIYEKADIIIKGKVVSSTVELMSHRIISDEEAAQNSGEDNPVDKMVTTIYMVEISEIYKGEAGDTINLLQLGGETEDEIWIYEDAADIELNTEYVMFLCKSVLHENSAWPVNEPQSLYAIQDDILHYLKPDFGAGYDNLLDFLQSKQS